MEEKEQSQTLLTNFRLVKQIQQPISWKAASPGGLELDDLQWSLPTFSILQFCDDSKNATASYFYLYNSYSA